MPLDLQNRFACVFDLDNTLYADRDEAGHDISTHFVESFVRTAQALLPGLTEHVILEYMSRSYVHCGMSSVGFSDIAADHGHDPHSLCNALHSGTSRLWFETVTRDYPERLRPCAETVALFSSLVQKGVRNGCLSHSCKESWAEPVLDRLGLRGFFDVVMGAACSNFMSKQLSTVPIGTILHRLGSGPEEAIFFEDSLKNLEKAKDLDSRLLTVHIHRGHMLTRVPSFVDLSVVSHLEALRALEEAHRSRRPRYVPVAPLAPVFAPAGLSL